MDKTQHTPGPWRCSHIGTDEAKNKHVHTFEVYTSPENEHSNEIGNANALLISKAWLIPELVEACESFQQALTHEEICKAMDLVNAVLKKVKE